MAQKRKGKTFSLTKARRAQRRGKIYEKSPLNLCGKKAGMPVAEHLNKLTGFVY